MYDLFASAGRDWKMLVDGAQGSAVIEPFTVSSDGRRFQAGNGVWIEPDYALENSPVPDGLSPMEYVHTLRLEEAKQMLEAGELPIEVVADEVGYEDASFFGRLFRRKVGLTPAEYRKRFGGLRKVLQASGQ